MIPALKRSNVFITLIFSLVFFGTLQSQDLPNKPVGHVNDFADMLQRSEVQHLENKLRNFRDTTSNVIGIVTLPDLQGYPIEDVSIKLANDWNMWTGDRFNGVLVVIARNERQMRIEVGYGLEGALPDILAGRIVEDILRPNFRQGDFYGGLDEATTAIMQLVQGEYEGTLTEKRSGSGSSRARLLLFLAFIAFVYFMTRRKGGGGKGGRRRRQTLHSGGIIVGGFGGGFGGSSSGGGGFGGFSGGGGFGFGGGGASGGW